MPSIGKSIPHESAVGHVTGTALYLDDLPPRQDELFVGFVGSPVASGRVESVDVAAARAHSGVVAVLSACDLPGDIRFGLVYRDEPILAEGEVLYVGQPVIVIAAESRAALEA